MLRTTSSRSPSPSPSPSTLTLTLALALTLTLTLTLHPHPQSPSPSPRPLPDSPHAHPLALASDAQEIVYIRYPTPRRSPSPRASAASVGSSSSLTSSLSTCRAHALENLEDELEIAGAVHARVSGGLSAQRRQLGEGLVSACLGATEHSGLRWVVLAACWYSCRLQVSQRSQSR